MKSKTFILVPALVLLLAGTVALEAEAGLFGRDKDKDTERGSETWRYNRLPTMDFARGRIRKDTLTAWEIGSTQVVFGPDCKVIDSFGEPCHLGDGNEVMIMGPRAGNTIVAWQVRVLRPGYQTAGYGKKRSTITWSDSDPTVGVDSSPE